MPLTLEAFNAASAADAAQMLTGLYEQASWDIEAALAQRPFATLAQLQVALAQALMAASPAEKLARIRAHPPLLARARRGRAYQPTAVTEPSADELVRIHQLDADYQARFGFPFVLSLRGPRGTGLAWSEVIATCERRLDNPADVEIEEALRQLQRIAELRLNDKFGYTPTLGNDVWDWQERLAQHSDPGFAELGQLTVTYLTDAHRACAQRISYWMNDCGFDEVRIDAVGNVVGRYYGTTHAASDGAAPETRALLTGSHYDTVRNGGKYDGRLGIFVPMACVRELHRAGKRLPFAIEVVGFSEEEGQRYQATFLGSGALIGDFDLRWLEQKDADGITMREAMERVGLCIADIPKLKRDPSRYLGFVEVHIEQGPVLNELGLPLGVVSSINGSARYLCELTGMASHAGTTPMNRRRDAAAGAAELLLYVEKRAAQDGDSVATIGQLEVPNGSINVVPGRCTFSLDMRAPTNAQRDALAADILAELAAIAKRRGLRAQTTLAMQAAAAPSAPDWQRRWEHAVAALGLPVHVMPSGAGHDAMKLHEIMPQAMLFVRGLNGGISHNPLESSTSDDMQRAVDAFSHLLGQLAADLEPHHDH